MESKRCRVSVIVVITVALMMAVSCRAPEPVPLTVAAVSMNAQTDKAANLERFASYMADAAEQGVHLVVFPEIALQQNPGLGYQHRPTPEEMAYVEDTAESIPGESTAWLTDKARELEIYVIFGMIERGDDGKLYNASVFLGPQGVLAHYRKTIFWDASGGGNEDRFWEPGPEQGMVVDSPLGRVGLITVYEITYFGPSLCAAGADLIAAIGLWPEYAYAGAEASGDMYDQAVEYNVSKCDRWHVVANQVGKIGQMTAYGHSRIVDPSGNVIADTDSEEGMVVAQTDLLVDPAALSGGK